MDVVFGGRALARFQLERLAREIMRAGSNLKLIDAVHFYLLERGAPQGSAARIADLLNEGEPAVSDPRPSLFQLPRFGTVSPWSSKASDIFADCGLAAAGRVERGVAYVIEGTPPELGGSGWRALEDVLADRMTQTLLPSLEEAARLFAPDAPAQECLIPLQAEGEAALVEADQRLGLALGQAERDYLLAAYGALGRDPTETELMMFAQVNSEHCRHKIFRGRWTLDGEPMTRSLFDCIRESYRASPGGILSAYKDNAAVLSGHEVRALRREAVSGHYVAAPERLDIAIKVETHNHPTGVAPFPGAATGSGGEIRDEAATGRGASAKAGLSGYVVSNLEFPDALRPWERGPGAAPGLASALEIMLEAPIGAAAFNNEFGRPAIAGFFRSFCVPDRAGPTGRWRGYHKPIMLAGGLGAVRRELVEKRRFGPGSLIAVLGGPAMTIGLGGGAASSRAGGEDTELDFASVQRGNPEMQRRAQEVIESAIALGESTPILAIHDVGAGGLSNAIPELLNDAGLGGRIDLARVPAGESGMSAMALWCNEAQERYVLAIAPEEESAFSALCERERCPWAVVGEATAEKRLVVIDGRGGGRTSVVDLPMRTLLGDLPPLEITGETRRTKAHEQIAITGVTVKEALSRVLALPGVGDKSFLITIGDRTVGGLVARDPMVGPWQIAVGDVAVTLADYEGVAGEAMALGERMPVALEDAAASARLAVGEALTNIAAADIGGLSDVKLSANWMAAAGEASDNADLYRAVRAVGAELCPALGIAIPVGKDSLSMRVAWREGGEAREVLAPLSLAVTAFAPVADAGKTLTPVLARDLDSELWLIDLGGGRHRLGASAFAQVFMREGDPVPDPDNPELLKGFFAAVRKLAGEGRLLAYHDRSDGGLALTLIEMALAGHAGLEVNLAPLGNDSIAALFAEELGAVIQTRVADRKRIEEVFAAAGLDAHLHRLGRPRKDDRVKFAVGGKACFEKDWPALMHEWSEVSYRIRAVRDDPECAREEYTAQCKTDTPGLAGAKLGFDPVQRKAPATKTSAPRVAILREQGVNGHRELAAVFIRAGFEAVDLHMSELAAGTRSLDGFAGLAAPGGFSYGDVLGAGQGWAKSILFNPRLREPFAEFLAREDRFAIGICNGCQMFAALAELIPGAEYWPRFRRNRSRQFEARLSLVEVGTSISPFFEGMSGSVLPVVVAHGEGRAEFAGKDDLKQLQRAGQAPLRYVEAPGIAAESYPANPNGSPHGATGFINADGRVLILMPHPERAFRVVQHSWHPPEWGGNGPWMKLFDNIHAWVAGN